MRLYPQCFVKGCEEAACLRLQVAAGRRDHLFCDGHFDKARILYENFCDEIDQAVKETERKLVDALRDMEVKEKSDA
jgi:hypothetical protein